VPVTSVQWLGINAVRFEHEGCVVLLDPYVTRAPDAPSDPEYLARHFPRADAIVVSHGHWDHLADVPTLARLTGATVVGSATTTNICRAYGLPHAQLATLGPGEQHDTPEFSVLLLPSRHAVSAAGEVPYPGIYMEPPALPLRREDYLEGGTFAPLFRFGEHTILDVGSANCIDEALSGLRCDLLLVSIARMENTPRFLTRLLGQVSAERIAPVHFDVFTRPLEDGLAVQPYVDIPGFVRQARALAPDAEIRVPDHFDTVVLP
jgi:L-ascorbate metabolism protein UlaG (beta-lactamase superfamily)